MATYKYQQNMFEGASEGYVKYNITPDFGTVLSVGDTFDITGVMYSRNLKRYGVIVYGGVTLDSNGFIARAQELGRVAKVCEKGRTATFSLKATVTDALAKLSDERGFSPYISFSLADNEDFVSSSDTKANANQRLSALAYRLAPVINGVTISDSAGAYAHFGGAVEGKSNLTFDLDVTLDPLDPSLTIAGVNFIVGEKRYEVRGGSIIGNAANLGVVDFNGSFDSYTLTVIDSKEKYTNYIGGSFVAYPYRSPTLSAYADKDLAERYSVSLDDSGGEVATADDAGIYLWASYAADIIPINGRNAWTITRKYAEYGYAPGDAAVAASGFDGVNHSVVDDQSVFPRSIVFAANKRYTVQLTLADYFETVTLTFDVDNAGGYFNVEKYGVAVGMRSTGTEQQKKFESAYPIYAYGGIEGVTNFTTEEVATGGTWIDGKPIYQRTFVGTVSKVNTNTNIGMIEGFESYVDMWGYLLKKDSLIIPLNRTFLTSTTNMTSFTAHITAARGVNCRTYGDGYTGTVYITVQYTKSS